MKQLPVPIIRSKLYPPPLAHDAISRERLDALAVAVANCPVTLVSAPAGYGKSTQVSHWFASMAGCTAWLSLDPADSDLRQFLAYLVAALRSTFPACCAETAVILEATPLPSPEELAGICCNDIDDLDTSAVLVLDDYHHISSADVHAFVDALLRRPPRGLHLVIVTRRDPPLSLQVLRANGALTEVRMRQLAFTEEESAEFLRSRLGDSVGAQAVATLHERTEGWPAGLRLAMLALPESGDASEFMERIPAQTQAARSYLLHEVLAKCSDAMRACLLRTAFLDRFCASLCEAVCVDGEGTRLEISGSEFIRRIDAAGFFCIALDERKQWLRYHHMFQRMLQEQALDELSADEVRGIHRRAVSWFESHDLLEEAISHTRAADGALAVADLIVRHRNALMNNEQWHRLDAWLQTLPPDLVSSRPELLFIRARYLRSTSSRKEFKQCLDQAVGLTQDADIDAATRRELLGWIASNRGYQSYLESDGTRAVELEREALELLPPTGLAERGFAQIILGAGLQMMGEFAEARRVYYTALADPCAIGAQNATHKTRLLVGLSFINWMHGDLNALKPLVDEAAAIAVQADLREAWTVARSFEAAIHYQRNDLTAVDECLRDLLGSMAIASGQFHVQCVALASLAHQARGNADEACRLMDQLHAVVRSVRNLFLVDAAEAFAAELALRQGREAEARYWAEQYDPGPMIPMFTPLSPVLVLAKTLVLVGGDDGRARAGALLETLIDYLGRTHNNRFLAEALALRALLREAAGQSEEALADLRAAIDLALPGHFIRLFVDLGPALGRLLSRLELDDEALGYVGEILAAFRQERNDGGVDSVPGSLAAQQIGVESLSRRELQILGLLAARLSDKEIAAKLQVSPVTIKRHAANIYQKLGVHSRRQAVAKAAGLGIFGKSD